MQLRLYVLWHVYLGVNPTKTKSLCGIVAMKMRTRKSHVQIMSQPQPHLQCGSRNDNKVIWEHLNT